MNTYSPDISRKDSITVSGPDGKGVWSCTYFAFNTEILLQTYGNPAHEADIKTGFDAAVQRCRTFERLLSRHLPESDITRINQAGGAKTRIAPETYRVLEASLRYCEASGGVFDITMGSVCRLWNFSEKTLPDTQELESALSHVDWHVIELGEDSEGFWARLLDPAASLDVGGIAKGFIADELHSLLIENNFDNAIINLGGNVVAFGTKPDGTPWTIGIRNPAEPATLIGAVPLVAGSVVTSGLYERCFIRDGIRYHHILDPKTGFPVTTDIAGATIVSERSLDGDGYSTTVFALGSTRALEFVENIPGIEALLVLDDGSILCTSGLEGFIKL